MTASTQSESYNSTNGSSENKKAPPILQANPLEANSIFPVLSGSLNNPQTTYKSSYFQDSYLFPWNPDSLSRNNNYAIYDEMVNDDQVKAAISFKKDIVVNSGHQIVCENEEIKDFVTDCLDVEFGANGIGNSIDDILRDILSSYEYGFTLTEPVYELKEGRYQFKDLRVRPPHSFRFDIDRFGTVLKVIQSTDREELHLDPEMFLHHVYQSEFGNPFGKSDLKAAHPAWVAKKFFMRMYAIYVERFASPTVVGKYKAEGGADEATRFLNMLKTLQTKTTFVVPDDLMIEFQQVERDATDTYIKGLDMFNLWISRAILVPDLLGIGGSKTSGGSYSLGQTQFKLFLNTIEKDRKSLARKVTLKLVKPLVLANFGDKYDCKFEFMPISEADELEYSKVWSDFMKSRITKPTEEEINHFRRSVKFPEGVVELQEPVQPGFGEEKEKEDEDKEKKQEGIKEEPEKKEPKEEKKLALKQFRELTPFERAVNFTRIKETLDASEKKIAVKLTRAGKMIINDLVDQVKFSEMIKRFNPEQINQLQPRFLKDMNVVFKDYFVSLFHSAYNEAQKEIFPNATKKFSDAELLPEEFLRIVEAEAFKNVGDYSIEVTKKGKNVLLDGIKTGLSESQILKAMKDDMFGSSERWIDTVVRTKTTEIYNSARKTYWETDAIAKEIVEAYEFSAIMDDRVSDVCAELDGKVFEKGDFIDKITPPLHFNCRSLLVPITKFQEYTSDKEPSLEKLQKLGGNLIT